MNTVWFNLIFFFFCFVVNAKWVAHSFDKAKNPAIPLLASSLTLQYLQCWL